MHSAMFNDSKIAYLEKIFGFVGVCHGAPLEANPAKVLAGLEPEKTSNL
jgi:hypothetical protein